MEIEICWYQNSTESKWAYDLTDSMMMILDAIISLASRTCVFLCMKKMFNDFLIEKSHVYLFYDLYFVYVVPGGGLFILCLN